MTQHRASERTRALWCYWLLSANPAEGEPFGVAVFLVNTRTDELYIGIQNARVLRLDPVARDILIEVLAQLRTDAQVRGGTAVARGIVEEWSNYFTMGEPRFTGLSDDMRVVMARLQARL